MQERPAWVRKNIDIDQRKLAIARVALGTSTEKATADAALDAIQSEQSKPVATHAHPVSTPHWVGRFHRR